MYLAQKLGKQSNDTQGPDGVLAWCPPSTGKLRFLGAQGVSQEQLFMTGSGGNF